MAEVGLVTFARMAMKVATDVPPRYRSELSNRFLHNPNWFPSYA